MSFFFKASIPLEEPAAFMVDLLFICQTTTDQPLRAASPKLRSIIFFQPKRLDTQLTPLAQIQTSTMVAKTKRKRPLAGNRDTVVRVGEKQPKTTFPKTQVAFHLIADFFATCLLTPPAPPVY